MKAFQNNFIVTVPKDRCELIFRDKEVYLKADSEELMQCIKKAREAGENTIPTDFFFVKHERSQWPEFILNIDGDKEEIKELLQGISIWINEEEADEFISKLELLGYKTLQFMREQ